MANSARAFLVYHLLQRIGEAGLGTLTDHFHDLLVWYLSKGLVNLELANDELVCEVMLFVLHKALRDQTEKYGQESIQPAKTLFGRLLEEQKSSPSWYNVDKQEMVDFVTAFCVREKAD
jgi:hypothetical protein